MSLFGQKPPRNSIAMATSKVPGDQKLVERVCYMLKLNVTKFQLPTPYQPTCSPICQKREGLRNSGEKLALIHFIRSEFLEHNLCEALC